MHDKIHRSTFESTWEQLVPLPVLRKIFTAYGPPKRRPAKLKPWALVKGMIFHAIQGTGTLAANMKAATGRKISDSALAQRRARLGWEPFEWILQAALAPKAKPKDHPEAFYRGKRLVALDGTKFSVANTPQISGVMCKAASRRLKAAFAKVGLCSLVELGLRNPIAAAIGIKEESENALAAELLDQIPEDALVLGDRLYGVRPVIEPLMELGQEFLFRIKSTFTRQLLKVYCDGSALIEIKATEGTRQVRELTGRVRRPGGKWVTVRLWTSLLDPQAYPAEELLQLYAKRWEEEVFYKELKIDMRSYPLLQSHTPETAAQEVAALLLAHAILVEQRIQAAKKGDVEVLRISFRKTLAIMQPLWLVLSCGEGIISEEQARQLTRRAIKEIAETAIPKRRQRSSPRAVRQPVSGWPRLMKNSYQEGPTTYQVNPITQ